MSKDYYSEEDKERIRDIVNFQHQIKVFVDTQWRIDTLDKMNISYDIFLLLMSSGMIDDCYLETWQRVVNYDKKQK